jgi:imidazolonepropionase-like amidohydrolase
MTYRTRLCVVVIAAAAAFVASARADAPHVYAIKGARLMTAAGAPIPSGTIVIRNGVVDAVGADASVPPDAMVIEGAGLTVYPGLIDMGNSAGVDAALPAPPATFRSTEEAERWKRGVIFQPELDAGSRLRADAPELSRLAAAGITTVLATPPGSVVKGRSALVNVAGPVDEPQIGNVGDYRRGLQVVRTPVALHIDVGSNGRGGGYPVSLLGVIAFVRQGFLDAQHQRLAEDRYERSKSSVARPAHDPSLTALQPALDGKLPVAFEADSVREIIRALNMAKEFKLDPMITGAREADQAAADLKARNARVIYSLNFPIRSRALAPDADEPIATLRTRANAPKVPAALDKAGVQFAFSSSGLQQPRDFVRNAARAVREGLSPDAALRALTINAARIAGAGERLGSLEKGKIANVIVTDGDLFEDRTTIKHVFVDGRLVDPDQAPPPTGRGGRGRGIDSSIVR